MPLPGSYVTRRAGFAVFALHLAAFAQLASAADGDLDPTFGDGGVQTTDFNRSTDIANAVGIQADGKLLVAGTDDLHE